MQRYFIWLYAALLMFTSIMHSSPAIEATANSSNSKTPPKEFINLTVHYVGMFSSLMSALGALEMYENNVYAGVKIDFGVDGVYGTYYDPKLGPNWWEYYFESVYVGNEKNATPIRTINGAPESNFAMHIETCTPRKRVNELIKKYIHVKPHIQKIVDDFIDTNFSADYVIGVHYRGTDKVAEAPQAPYEIMTAHINRILSECPTGSPQIFVATDEQAFLEYIKKQYPGKIICNEHAIRSNSAVPVHLGCCENYKKGEDALVDCLLLSRCNSLIKTSSNLSLCSSYFNPNIPVYHVTARYGQTISISPRAMKEKQLK